MVKSQTVRILDVVLIGPLMVWGGLVARRLGGVAALAGWTLAALGIGTIWYNALNWRRVQDYSAGTSRTSQT